MDQLLFIFLLMDILVDAVNIVNSAALTIELLVSFYIMIFSGSKARGGLARSCGGSIFTVLRNLHTVVLCGRTYPFPSPPTL